MAVRKFLFFNASEGFPQEQATVDEIALGKITATGVGGVAFDASGQVISNVGTPVATTDAANKAYVDSVAVGLDWKASVRAMANTNITTTGPQTIDGVSLIAGERVLLTAQSTGSQNGIYVVAAGAWSRSPDAATSSQVNPGMALFVEEGTVFADTGWLLTTDAPIVLGTTSLAFTQFNGGGAIVGGAGILKTGGTLDIELDTGAAAQTAGSAGGSSGLEFDAAGAGGKLRAAVNATGGLQRSGTGLSVLLDGTTLASAAGGLSVAGVPSLFTINAVATSANVTAANVNTLTAGASSDASALHNHPMDLQIWTAQAAVAKGQAVYISSNNQVSPGVNTALVSSRIVGIANAAIAGAANGPIATSGIVTGVLSGATAGDPYFMSATGTPVLLGSLASGARMVRMGYAVNATDLQVVIQDIGQKA